MLTSETPTGQNPGWSKSIIGGAGAAMVRLQIDVIASASNCANTCVTRLWARPDMRRVVRAGDPHGYHAEGGVGKPDFGRPPSRAMLRRDGQSDLHTRQLAAGDVDIIGWLVPQTLPGRRTGATQEIRSAHGTVLPHSTDVPLSLDRLDTSSSPSAGSQSESSDRTP